VQGLQAGEVIRGGGYRRRKFYEGGGDCWLAWIYGMLMNNSDVFDDSGRAVLGHGCDVCDGGICSTSCSGLLIIVYLNFI